MILSPIEYLTIIYYDGKTAQKGSVFYDFLLSGTFGVVLAVRQL